jgi:hypothetical protein
MVREVKHKATMLVWGKEKRFYSSDHIHTLLISTLVPTVYGTMLPEEDFL